MNDMDRDIGLVLLKRLRQRGFISEDIYHAARQSKVFDRKRFAGCGDSAAGTTDGDGEEI